MERRNLALAGALVVAGILMGWLGRGFAAAEAALPGSQQDPLVSKSYVDERLKMAVVQVPAGKELIGYGGTEIVVRSGSATEVDTELAGQADVTAGVDLRSGETAPVNHLLIVPRDDGRGVKAQTSLFVLVRGNYEVRP